MTPALYLDRDGSLWCFDETGSWVFEPRDRDGWLRGPMQRGEAERGYGPLVEVPPTPDGAL